MGLCFGGGQIGLGITMLAMGLVVLAGLRWMERRMNQDRRTTLILTSKAEGPSEEDVRRQLSAARFQIVSLAIVEVVSGIRRLHCVLQWRAPSQDLQTPSVIQNLRCLRGMMRMEWRP